MLYKINLPCVLDSSCPCLNEGKKNITANNNWFNCCHQFIAVAVIVLMMLNNVPAVGGCRLMWL